MDTRFWVVGGEYTDMSFNQLVHGSESVLGPFMDRDSAVSAWKRAAEETRGKCRVRFTVAQEPVRRST